MTRNSKMSSSKPSAFDARGAAKKELPCSSSLRPHKKKRESPDNSLENQSDDVVHSRKRVNGVIDSNSSPLEVKQLKNPSASSVRVAELKRKIAFLKKKPSDFDPKTVDCWEDYEEIPFLLLCLAFDLISNEKGRIVITDLVCNVLRVVMATRPDDLLAVVYLLSSRIGPAHEGLELRIRDTHIIKVLGEVCGRTEENLSEQYEETGDLGLVARECRSSQSMLCKPHPLTVGKVFETFRSIAQESGHNSDKKKMNHIKALLVSATDCEPLYLIRLLQTELRIGLAEQTLLVALGQAAVYAEKHSTPPPDIQSPLDEAARIVKQVYSVIPIYEKIVAALLSEGVWNLPKTCTFTVGLPVGPMLAKPTRGVSEIMSKFQNMVYTCEYKYDGERAQIHYMENGSVEIYSRAGRNSVKFPDVAVVISRTKKENVSSFVLDCELVAYDRDKQKILTFQDGLTSYTLDQFANIRFMQLELSDRAQKNATLHGVKVDVCIYAFDMLYVNGQPLLGEQLKVRREHLYESFKEEAGFFHFATAITSNNVEEIQTFLEAAVKASCEGIVIKTLDQNATYEPSKWSNNWLKLKKDYMDSIGDTVDLVPIAAFSCRGKRTGLYGAFLMACYDDSSEEFQSICKVASGFSEAELEELTAILSSKVIPKPKSFYRFSNTLAPDVWFEPTEVWEVKAADLTISPIYCAAIGLVDPDKGISLRFPRFIRVRKDRVPELVTSAEMVAELHERPKAQFSKIIN